MNTVKLIQLQKRYRKLLLPHIQKDIRVPSGMRPRIRIEISFEKVVVDPLVQAELKRTPKWVVSDQLFTDEEFEEILKIPLSSADRQFVEWSRTRRNKPVTPTKWMENGFAEHGRIVSINRICREHGLMLGIRPVTRYSSWPDALHKFFILKEKEFG